MGVIVGELDLASCAEHVAAVQQAASAGLDALAPRAEPALVARRAADPGVLAFGARAEGRMIGFCYGLPAAPEWWWYRAVAPHLTMTATRHWLDDAFVLAELHVLPGFQGQGVGTRLLRTLLERTDRRRGVLCTLETNVRARAFYRALGFRELAAAVHFLGTQPLYVVMGIELPLPAGAARR